MDDESKMSDEPGSGKTRHLGGGGRADAVPDKRGDSAGMSDQYALAIAIMFTGLILAASIYFSTASLSAALAGWQPAITNPAQLQAAAAVANAAPSAALAPIAAQAGAGCALPSAGAAPSAGGCGVPAGSPGSAAGAVANIDVSGRPVRGSPNAKVTIVEFADFECPFCQRAEPTVRQVMRDYDGKVKLVYMAFPLSFHQNAQKAAEGVECANDQGKLWEYSDRLYDTKQLDMPSLRQHAASLGLDTAKFNACLDGGANAGKVAAMQAAGSQNGVSGTPTFFINGQPLVGAQPYSAFKAAIDAKLSGQ